MINGKGMAPKKGYNKKNWDSNYDLIDWGRGANPQNMEKCPYCEGGEWVHIPCTLADACKSCGLVRICEGDGLYSKGSSIEEWVKDFSKEKPYLKEILEDAKKAKSNWPDWAKE